jgi:hypothetical protein
MVNNFFFNCVDLSTSCPSLTILYTLYFILYFILYTLYFVKGLILYSIGASARMLTLVKRLLLKSVSTQMNFKKYSSDQIVNYNIELTIVIRKVTLGVTVRLSTRDDIR